MTLFNKRRVGRLFLPTLKFVLGQNNLPNLHRSHNSASFSNPISQKETPSLRFMECTEPESEGA